MGEEYYIKISSRKFERIKTEKGIYEIIKAVKEGNWK